MKDILGQGDNTCDGRGYIGYRYSAATPPTSQEIADYAAKLRQEMGIELAGERAVEATQAEQEETANIDWGSLPNTTRPGYWF